MVTYFYGPDTYAARQAITTLAHDKGAKIHWLDREELEELSLTSWLDRGSSSLFGSELLVVRDPSAFPKALQEQIVAVITTTQTSSLVLWDRVAPDKRSALFKAVKAHAQEFPIFEQEPLSAWLIAETSARGGTLEKPAALALLDRVGKDKWQLLGELEKLLLRYDLITLQVIQQEVPLAQAHEQIFALLDAISIGNEQRAVHVMDALLLGGEGEFYILSMLAYQFRTLLTIRSYLDRGMTQQMIASEAGLHPYVVQKNTAAARRMSQTQLLEIITRIVATDFAIKQGKVDARTATVMLVLTLAKQATAVPHRS